MGDTFKGDERAPSTQKQGHLIYQGLESLPGITSIIGKNLARYEKMYTKAAEKWAPRQQDLEARLYEQYAPRYANVQNNLANIATTGELDRLRSIGLPAYQEAEAASRAADPEYYGTRALTSAKLMDLLNNPISGGEYEAMARGLMKMNPNMGTTDVMGATNTAANAALFGANARNRQIQNLGVAGSLLPQFKTTTPGDVYGIASSLGKTYNPNLFAKDSSINSGGYDLGNNMMSGLFGGQNTAMNINANRRSVMDYVGQAWQQSGLGQATASAAGGCWVARLIFGAKSPKWLMFRQWLRIDGPKWLWKLYLKYGERFAEWLKDKPRLQYIIKLWMEAKIYA